MVWVVEFMNLSEKVGSFKFIFLISINCFKIMLLIDGVYINNGGGKRLLDLLVKEITKKNLDVMYLFDKRILNEYKHLKLSNAKFISASLLQRHIFYLKNKKK